MQAVGCEMDVLKGLHMCMVDYREGLHICEFENRG